MTVRERLKIREEVAEQESKADCSATTAPTLEQRVTKLEETLTKHLRIDDGPENNPDGLSGIREKRTAHTGSSQTLNSKVSNDAIKEQLLAKAKTLFKTPQICLTAF